MSGEINRKKKGRGRPKKDDNQVESDGGLCVVSGKKEDNTGGASLVTKLTFGFLLVTFILASSLFLMDYKSGQAKQLISELSPEVLEALERAQEGIDVALDKMKIRETIGEIQRRLSPALDEMKIWISKATDEIEALSKKVNIGEKTLADYLFAARQKERMELEKEEKLKKRAGNKEETE